MAVPAPRGDRRAAVSETSDTDDYLLVADPDAGDPQSVPSRPGQPALYDDAIQAFGAALERLARSYELDDHKRQDLLQNIHFNLWRSLERFDGQCSLRTWVYRVAHNVAATHVIDERRRRSRPLVGLDEIDANELGIEPDADRHVLLSRLMALIQRLRPLDRELVVLYLEGLNAAEIGEVMGISAANVATRVSRIKKILSRQAKAGGRNVG
jgi:RNA polymerase sigma-70 factor (ECF subfamily)